MNTERPEVPVHVRVLALILAAGVLEISVLIFVGGKLGFLPTVGLLLLAAFAGSWLLRREGRRTLREFSEAARQRRPPTRELADGVLIAAGGILIILPGLVSDVAGLLCLFPPTRKLMRGRLQRAAERHSQAMQDQINVQVPGYGFAGAAGFPGAGGPGANRSRTDDVIDGEVISVSEDDEAGEKRGKTAGNPRIIDADPPARPGNSGSGGEKLA